MNESQTMYVVVYFLKFLVDHATEELQMCAVYNIYLHYISKVHALRLKEPHCHRIMIIKIRAAPGRNAALVQDYKCLPIA